MPSSTPYTSTQLVLMELHRIFSYFLLWINVIPSLSHRTMAFGGWRHCFLLFSSKFFFFFNVDNFLNLYWNLLQHCFCFLFCFFGPEARGILTPQPRMEPAPFALEGRFLTTGPPGKSLFSTFYKLLKGALHIARVCMLSCSVVSDSLWPHGL